MATKALVSADQAMDPKENTNIASPSFLSELKSLYPSSSSSLSSTSTSVPAHRNPWHIITAVSYCASNRPDALPHVLRFVLADVDQSGGGHTERLNVVNEMRDGMFKAGLICGYARTINALVSLYQATPEDLKDKEMMRDPHTSMEELTKRGQDLFQQVYGESSNTVQSLLDNAYPDMGFFSLTLGYGFTYSHTTRTSPLETVFIMLAAVIAMDAPTQVKWHVRNARRCGATDNQVRAVVEMVRRVAERCGVRVGVVDGDGLEEGEGH